MVTALALPAAGAGAAFQSLPLEAGLIFYFAFALPLLLAAALAGALARQLRAGGGAARLVAAGGLLAFPAFTPASAFGWTFLVHYEVFQFPLLLLALFSLAWLVRDPGPAGGPDAAGPGGPTLGERLAAPVRVPLAVGGPLLVAGAVLAGAALRPAPLPDLWAPFAWALLLLAAGVGFVLVLPPGRRFAAGALPAAAAGAVFAGLLGARFGAEALHAVGGGPAAGTAYFYLAGAGLVLFFVAAAVGLAALAERAARTRLSLRREALVHGGGLRPAALPAGFRHERVATVPSLAGLVAFRERVLRAGASGGVLEVEAPNDPLAGLPPELDAWLGSQSAEPFVHVAVREGQEVFLVPLVVGGDVLP